LLVILLAAAIVFYLQGRSATESFQAVTRIAANLREEGVDERAFDRRLAERMVASLQELLDSPEDIPNHIDDLRTIAATTASWAQAAASPSLELRISVALRGAAGDLREYGIGKSPFALKSAAKNLEEARAALAGEESAGNPAIDAVRDRMENLRRSQQEQHQDIRQEIDR
jgi:hypothetical protein